MDSSKLANWALRAAIAFAFLYPPYAALQDPTSWLSYFPHFVLATTQGLAIPDLVVLHAFGLLEVVLALWILSGWRVYIPATVAALILLAIVVLDFADFEVLFRDLALALAALSLALHSFARHTSHI